MELLVFYHHPRDERFSLNYSSDSVDELREKQRETDGETKVVGYPFDTPVYVLYEGTEAFQSANEVDYDPDWLEDRLGGLPRSTQVTAFRLIELLEAAVDVRETNEFHLYKEFEPERVHQALDNVSWGEALPTVAGELLSNLVLRHALPNANHRTGIAMAQFCIESIDPAFVMPSTHVDDHEWREWADPFIVESKRLITVRRNNIRFKRLDEFGIDLVERKGGVQIRLSEYDLDMHWHEALTRYAQAHEHHCVDFVCEILRRAGRGELVERAGPTLAEFVEFVETGVVERDFRELF